MDDFALLAESRRDVAHTGISMFVVDHYRLLAARTRTGVRLPSGETE